MQPHTSVAPISAQDFINQSTSILQLPPFNQGQPTIPVQVRKVGIMSLMVNGSIPNTLMSTVMELFGEVSPDKLKDAESISELEGQLAANANAKLGASGSSNIAEMGELMSAIAKATLVSPTYDEIGMYLTDDQRTALFEHSMESVKNLESFRKDSGNGNGADSSGKVLPIA